MQIEFTDNSGRVKEELDAAVIRILEECGLVGEGYAARLCPVDTGNLQNSISHQVQASEQAVYIGTNSEYGAFVELGTGIYYPGGRDTPWVYQDAKGNWHLTHGQRAKPYIKPAVANHANEYYRIMERELKGGR